MHAIAGNLRNMKHKGLPLLTVLTHQTYGKPINLHRIRRRAASWIFELLDDPEPVRDVHIQLSKCGNNIETHISYQILNQINAAIQKRVGTETGKWRFTGFDFNGDPVYFWRAP